MSALRIMMTPNHLVKLTCSCNTKLDIITATGNSTELKIELNVNPALGIPVEKQIGGITVPKTAKIIPHFNKLPTKAPLIINCGDSTIKIKIQAPVIINALFLRGG